MASDRAAKTVARGDGSHIIIGTSRRDVPRLPVRRAAPAGEQIIVIRHALRSVCDNLLKNGRNRDDLFLARLLLGQDNFFSAHMSGLQAYKVRHTQPGINAAHEEKIHAPPVCVCFRGQSFLNLLQLLRVLDRLNLLHGIFTPL